MRVIHVCFVNRVRIDTTRLTTKEVTTIFKRIRP